MNVVTSKVRHFALAACVLAAAAGLLSLFAPAAARADDLIVEHNPAAGNFATIQEAIQHARDLILQPANLNKSYRVVVKASPGNPYSGSFTPISNVSIVGENTANTTLSGSGTLATVSGVSGVQIRNFTFLNASVAIAVSNGTNIDIMNNVFDLGTGGTAVQVLSSPTTTIVNNTFYLNGTAIATNSDILITNDIFSNNSVAINSQATLTRLSYNDFFLNGSNGVADLGPHSIPNNLLPVADPLFTDPANRDFTLKPASPAHLISGSAAGNPAYPDSFDSASFDMGAYGGPNSDLLLVPVRGLTSVLTTPSTITLNWTASSTGAVTAYRVYYGTSSGNYHGAQAVEGASPVLVRTNAATLSGLPTGDPAAPASPANVAVAPLNDSLQVTWDPVPGASGYDVFYGTASFTSADLPATFFHVAASDHPSYRIGNLVNGTRYYVAVRAVAQTVIFTAVTAVIDSSVAPNFGVARANESAYSAETSQPVSQATAGDISAAQLGTPEATVAFPNLKNEGCFIATAAYGCYSAPQVQVLRDFRDRYLMTNAPGRAFVAWYYRYGPRGAHFLNLHPWLKPPVRLALLPLVVGSLFLLHTSSSVKIAIVLLAITLSFLLFKRAQRRMLVLSGGAR